LYYINDDYYYIFPNNGFVSFIIDFSRSIINPYNVDIFKDAWLPINFQIVLNEEKFIVNEMNNLLSLYVQLFPNKIKQKDELVVLFKNNFEPIFRLLTCIDLYMFSVRLLRAFRQNEEEVGKKCIGLIEKINKMSETFINSDVNNLLNDTIIYSKKILKDDYPILTIIKECFSEYNKGIKFTEKGIITDIYKYNNDMKYSLSKYDTIPDIYKYNNYYVGDKLKKNEEFDNLIKNLFEERQLEKVKNLEMVNYISLRHAQKMF